ncbi:hypothetical protein K438DRAFT_1761712 [Mycena galopus ATCC 62051]|nr:hypothetical protein K438DRAFT_1761712 [Mycena galopus ATCC 62051]
MMLHACEDGDEGDDHSTEGDGAVRPAGIRSGRGLGDRKADRQNAKCTKQIEIFIGKSRDESPQREDQIAALLPRFAVVLCTPVPFFFALAPRAISYCGAMPEAKAPISPLLRSAVIACAFPSSAYMPPLQETRTRKWTDRQMYQYRPAHAWKAGARTSTCTDVDIERNKGKRKREHAFRCVHMDTKIRNPHAVDATPVARACQQLALRPRRRVMSSLSMCGIRNAGQKAKRKNHITKERQCDKIVTQSIESRETAKDSPAGCATLEAIRGSGHKARNMGMVFLYIVVGKTSVSSLLISPEIVLPLDVAPPLEPDADVELEEYPEVKAKEVDADPQAEVLLDADGENPNTHSSNNTPHGSGSVASRWARAPARCRPDGVRARSKTKTCSASGGGPRVPVEDEGDEVEAEAETEA